MAVAASKMSRVTLRKNPDYQRSGLKSYAHLLQKYNIKPTVDGPFYRTEKGCLTRINADGKSGEVPAEAVQHGSQYLAPVGLGTPMQTLKLDFDTGSSDLWVWSNKLPTAIQNKAKVTGHAIFDTNNSSTWHDSPGQVWKVRYGDGSSARGDVGTDTLTVGGLVIKDQAIERAVQLSEEFEKSAGDGLLGLGFGKLNTVKPHAVKTPVENMISQKDIPKASELFTAYLGSWHNKSDGSEGESFYTFGHIDQDVVDACGEEIHYANVDNSNGFWQFESCTAAINGNTLYRSGNTAIADTGTTLALVDDELCEAIYRNIPGAKQDNEMQGWVFPAGTAADQLPVVQFAVGLKLFQVEKECLSFADAGNGMVYGGIQSRGDLPMDILGDTFLKSVYAVFDQGNKRFGCVQRQAATR